MDILTNKRYKKSDYTDRYAGVPYYYNTQDGLDIFGIGTNVVKKNVVYVSHKLQKTDTLDSLALEYYGNPTLWWYIAYFNDINDPFDTLIVDNRDVIRIPPLAALAFGAER